MLREEGSRVPMEDIREPRVFSLMSLSLSLFPSPHRDLQGRRTKAISKPLGPFLPVSSQEQEDLREKEANGRYWGAWKLHAAG